jgi:hypothetical protein
MCDGGPGTTTILLCSDYQMRSFVGVRFYDSGSGSGDDGLRIVTGTGWTEITAQGDHYHHVVPSNGNYYTIRYSLTTNKVSVWVGDSTGSPVLEWADTSHLVQHGAGFRYVGGTWNASFVTSGPQMYYFKAKDSV